ncbi:MAG: helix-turn-helix domain-containing protein [Gammaproteobacteria bacterium]
MKSPPIAERSNTSTSDTLDNVAQRRHVHRATLYREIAAGRLRVTKIGNATRITDIDEDAWIEHCRNRAKPPK